MKLNIRLTVVMLSTLLLLIQAQAAEIKISSPTQLTPLNNSLQPGDTVLLASGKWADVDLLFSGKGTKEAPITLKAEVPGQVVLTGKSHLRIAGEYLVVEGLHFQEPDTAVSDVIQFRGDSKTPSNHCRLTNCAMTSTGPQNADAECRWVGLYGQENRLDHCRFEGKTGKGTTVVVWLNAEGDGRHQLDHNYFGPREKLGKNGGETIRVGDSKTSMMKAACLVERNIFEKCTGEAECISNKSCGNLYRENTFLEVQGTLTLRHGNGCVVEGNVFLGNNVNGTGGIRIIGEDHQVRGNYLEKLGGDKARAGICFMMGIPDSPLNRYFQVKRARLENNVLVDCKQSFFIGLADDKNGILPPVGSVIRGNTIISPKRSLFAVSCSLTGLTFEKNRCYGSELGMTAQPGLVMNPETKAAPLKALSRAEVGPKW